MTLLWGEIKRSSAEKEIQAMTKESMQSGTNPRTGGNYKPLAESTIKQRQTIARKTRTDPSFEASFANNTITGQLAKAIRAVVLVSRRKVRVFVRDSKRRPYRTTKGKAYSTIPPNNAQVANYLDRMGREVLYPSKKIIEAFNKIIEPAKRAAGKKFKGGNNGN